VESKKQKVLLGCGTIIGGVLVVAIILLIAIGFVVEKGFLPDTEMASSLYFKIMLLNDYAILGD
jgi:hypothetical protein